MPYRSFTVGAMQRVLEATDAGLVAAASVYQTEMKDRLGQGFPHAPAAPGYFPGKYVTGHSARSVVVASPEWDGGNRVIRVGTNLMYNLYWELGWSPAPIREVAFLPEGTYRSEVWLPTFFETREQQMQAFVVAAQAAMQGAAGPMIQNEAAD